jgi:DNA-binding NarL/FixJ family response regulator
VSALANWFRQMTLHKRIPPEDYALLKQEYRSKEELHTMIVEAIRQEEAQIRQESAEAGKRERDRQHVQRMLSKGYAPTVIADLLGLSEAEVQTLRQEAAPQPPTLPTNVTEV